MKTYIVSSIAAALLASLPVFAAADGARITTEAEFRDKIVGKRLMLNDNWFIIQRNGKLRGNFGDPVRGVWAWRDGAWCRTLTKPRENTDCQIWEAVAGGYKVTRARGKGRSFVYTIK